MFDFGMVILRIVRVFVLKEEEKHEEEENMLE